MCEDAAGIVQPRIHVSNGVVFDDAVCVHLVDGDASIQQNACLADNIMEIQRTVQCRSNRCTSNSRRHADPKGHTNHVENQDNVRRFQLLG